MCGGRRATGLEPFSLVIEQRGFLLRPRHRNAEIVFTIQAEGGTREVRDDFRDLLLVNGSSLHASRGRRQIVDGQKLKGADTVAAYFAKEAECVSSLGSNALCNPGSDRF